ncbi:hypothetical protein [Capybara microvirus Cap1_SP_55]|nr:hypothetical protein [Capybara microvirus Cap1_SP_55]
MAGAAAFGSVLSTGMELGAQSAFVDRAQRHDVQMQKNSFRLSDMLQKNSASNNVQGLKMAGLSPALANGGSFSAPSVSAPTSSAPQVHVQNPLSAENLLADSQLKLNQEQGRIAEEKANQEHIVTQRMLDEDKYYDSTIRSELERELLTLPDNEYGQMRAVKIQNLLDEKDPFTVGLLNSSSFAKLTMENSRGMDISFLKDGLSLEQSAAQLDVWRNDPKLRAAVLALPKAEYNKVLAEISHLSQSIALMVNQSAESESRTMANIKGLELTDTQINNLKAQSEHIVRQIFHENNKDLVGLFTEGDYGTFVAAEGINLIDKIAQFISVRAGGKALGSAMKNGAVATPMKGATTTRGTSKRAGRRLTILNQYLHTGQ